jgi:dihydroorotase-like cyclic amidohydrolase
VARTRSRPAHAVVTPGRGGKLSGVTADEPLDPAEGGIVASTAAVLALRDLLVEKGIITPDEFDEALARHSAFIIEQLRQRRAAEGQDADRPSWSRWR